MSPAVKFSTSVPGADRIHYVNEHDIRVVLSRLPVEHWERLRAVHFNDKSHGVRLLGYVGNRRRDIALCALAPRMNLRRALRSGLTPEQFGALPDHKWPTLAVRRFMLYNVFLHEVGHLQLVYEKSHSPRLKFAREKLAQKYAMDWRKQLWSQPFTHPDPVHNPPTAEELAMITIL